MRLVYIDRWKLIRGNWWGQGTEIEKMEEGRCQNLILRWSTESTLKIVYSDFDEFIFG